MAGTPITRRASLTLAASLFATTRVARAQPAEWPSRPVAMVVPFAPGGATDILARLLAERLGEAWRQPVVVENRPGASGMIGTRHVARSTPDGYTLVMAAQGSLDTTGQPAGAYEVQRDFAPVALAAAPPSILVVHPAVPANTVAELLALARSRGPGGLHFGSSGVGAGSHLAGELFNMMGEVRIEHVPYRGVGPAMTDVIAGQIPMMFAPPPPALPHIASGRLRALGVTSARRSPLFPDIPTIAESGLAGYESAGWFGLLAPARTPAAIVQRINADARRILTSPEMTRRLADMGAEPGDLTAEQFAAFVDADVRKWAAVPAAAEAAARAAGAASAPAAPR